ncbi:MAG: hypothetical protein G01um10148_249 [Parcubacteria group bacterium Gr01-1014_8]|nr:MAG: hypothetical protein G01um10148_249 [Parcubacteria group bacterium Gr01-1014_8]
MTPSHRLGAAVVALLVFSAGVAHISQFHNSVEGYVFSVKGESDVMDMMRRDLPGIVDEKGAAFVVNVVDSLIKKKMITIDDCHLLLHLVGHKAYQEHGSDFESMLGVNKKRICLNAFVHGIEAEIASKGDKAEIWRFCAFTENEHIQNGPCYHGVGHSIFERTKDIHGSLTYCDSLTGGPEQDLSNCYRGVFSELGAQVDGYDTNTGLSIQPLDLVSQGFYVDKPYAYCSRLSARYQDSCYSQLSKLLFSSDNPLGSVQKCNVASTEHARSECVSTVTGMSVRILLDSGGAEEAANFLNSIGVRSQKNALLGVQDGYMSHCDTKEDLFSWRSFCTLLTNVDTRQQCGVLSPCSGIH